MTSFSGTRGVTSELNQAADRAINVLKGYISTMTRLVDFCDEILAGRNARPTLNASANPSLSAFPNSAQEASHGMPQK